ncbi:hypothetical protein ACFY1U_03240 [Streptomyces sp. NPDC001351]|uniref:hypothetical protein n=1 Tax=Streptomyces sp. NPDC001351 TaxID=3364564 RepID=UPI0036ABB93B
MRRSAGPTSSSPTAGFGVGDGVVAVGVDDEGTAAALQGQGRQLGRITARTDTNNSSYHYVYDEEGRCTSQWDEAGYLRNTFAYGEVDPDTGLRTVTATNSMGHSTRYRVNGDLQVGNRTQVTDSSGATTRFTHDALGHLSAITGARTTVRCHPAGLPLEITDPLGAVTRYERDTFGRPVSITDPTGAVTRLEWTVEGRLARRIPADGTTESWTYDGDGNCTSRAAAMPAPTSPSSNWNTSEFPLTRRRGPACTIGQAGPLR